MAVKKFAKLQVWPRGRAGGAAAMVMVGQRPDFGRVAVLDGHYDYHLERV